MRSRSAAIVAWCLAWLAPAVIAQTGPGDPDRPMNVLFLLTDDQRADAIGARGHPVLKTPAIDSLVARGTSFLDAYCMGSHSGAVCGPSRAMILTGQDLNRVGDPFNLDGSHLTLPERFRAAGYETFFTGKWHSGKGAFVRGFTHGGSIFFGGMGSHIELPVNDFERGTKNPLRSAHPLTEFSSTEFVSRAIEYLDGRAERGVTTPFFAMVSFTAPHDPRTPPGEFATMYDPATIPLPANFVPVHPFDNGEMTIRDEKLAAWPRTPEEVRENLAAYYGMISQMDSQIGRLLAELDRLGLTQSTIIVFASDHGLAIGSHGLMGKQNLYEHSTKSPLIVVDPRVGAGGSECEGLVYLYDIAPTLAELTGLPPSPAESSREESPFRARSLAGCLGGCAERVKPDGECVGRPLLFTAYGDVQRAIRDRRWKLIVYPKINRVQVFDLEHDPDEIHDLSETEKWCVERLRPALMRLQASAADAAPLEAKYPRTGVFNAEAAEAARQLEKGRP